MRFDQRLECGRAVERHNGVKWREGVKWLEQRGHAAFHPIALGNRFVPETANALKVIMVLVSATPGSV